MSIKLKELMVIPDIAESAFLEVDLIAALLRKVRVTHYLDVAICNEPFTKEQVKNVKVRLENGIVFTLKIGLKFEEHV